MAITNYNGILAARASGHYEDVLWWKVNDSSSGNVWTSGFEFAGMPTSISPSAIPGGSTLNNQSAGAYPITSPPSGNGKYLLTMGVLTDDASAPNAMMLVDLLWAASGINANTTAAQTVNSAALTRYTSGVGVMMTFAVTTALGATNATATVSYTNQAGVSGQTATALFSASSGVGRMPYGFYPFVQLAAGDSGVQSIQTVTLSAAMGAGVLNMYLFKPHIFMPSLGLEYLERDPPTQIDDIISLALDGSGNPGCLGFLFPCNQIVTAGINQIAYGRFADG